MVALRFTYPGVNLPERSIYVLAIEFDVVIGSARHWQRSKRNYEQAQKFHVDIPRALMSSQPRRGSVHSTTLAR